MDMTPEQIKIEREVKAYARNAHLHQTRKFGKDKGKSYFDTHVTRVAQWVKENGGTFDQVIAAWLHDVKEDCGDFWNETALKLMGVSQTSLDIVDSVTKREGENYLDFTLRIVKNPDAILVKIGDITDNSSDLNEGSMKDKYRFALHMLQAEENCNRELQCLD